MVKNINIKNNNNQNLWLRILNSITHDIFVSVHVSHWIFKIFRLTGSQTKFQKEKSLRD
jgi:hypothetical protein